jgi:hypothetical protein
VAPPCSTAIFPFTITWLMLSGMPAAY